MLAGERADGYHPQSCTPRSSPSHQRASANLYSENSTGAVPGPGQRHTENDLRPEVSGASAEPMGWFGTTEEKVAELRGGMRDSYGKAPRRYASTASRT